MRDFVPASKVTLVEPNAELIACPLSNCVLRGGLFLRDITRPYDRFASRHNINWVRAKADDIDAAARVVYVGGQKINEDRLISISDESDDAHLTATRWVYRLVQQRALRVARVVEFGLCLQGLGLRGFYDK